LKRFSSARHVWHLARYRRPAVCTTIDQVCSILSLPLLYVGASGAGEDDTGGGATSEAVVDPIDEDTLSRLQSIMYNQLVMRHLIASWSLLDQPTQLDKPTGT
jgi:hypothetical protein